MDISSPADIIHAHDLAIVIFTRGLHFHYDSLGYGDTGDWVVDREVLSSVNKVIIYWRDEKSGSNRIFLGKYIGAQKLPDRNRYKIRFSELKEIGTTSLNWSEFANSGQNPVSYLGDFV